MADDEEPKGKKLKNQHELDGKIIEVNIGKLTCYKSNGKFSKTPKTNCQIFRGKFENETKVFIRRFDKDRLPKNGEEKDKEYIRDMELLRQPDRTSHMHENFTRYFCCEQDDNFYYVAIEWCICSVEDLYVRDRKGYDWEGNEIVTDLIKASLKKKEILRQATKGVAFLHAMGFVHRNLKPSNFLIAQIQLEKTKDKIRFKYLVKVSDFRMSKDLVTDTGHSGQRGSEGWTSPYPSKHDANNDTQHPTTSEINNVTDRIKTHPSEDVFILGCFFHYVLTDGIHPFDRFDDTDRKTNINNKDYEVYKPEWTAPEIKTGDQTETAKELQQAVSLIKDMIKFNREDEISLETILDRAYFLPDDYYKLYDLPEIKPGLCVIFNQEIFEKKANNRPGTEEDKNALTDVFKKFGFDVETHDNLKAQQLCDEINKLAERDEFQEYACLVVCILSHGGEGTVCGTDKLNPEVSIEDAKKQFFNKTSLSGKPTIWIIQACQGNLSQEDLEKSTAPLEPIIIQIWQNPIHILYGWCVKLFGVIFPKKTSPHPTNQGNLPNTTDSVSHGFQPIQFQHTQQVVSQPPDIPRPPVSDILDIRATVPGFLSYRNTLTGSWLIRNLCEQLRATFLNEGEKSTRHLEDLLKMVQKSISEEKNFVPATEDDKKKFEILIKRIEENIAKIRQEEIEESDEKTKRIDAEIAKLEFKEVTENDVKNHENEIDLKTFRKIFDEVTQTLIFFRPCTDTTPKQTIEWRSTLMNFIRFEKKFEKKLMLKH